jgi:hypothetical protein
MDEPLFLPDDVLDIIRAFSKPSCRYWCKFKEVKSVLSNELLRDVTKKMCTSEADKVLAAVVAYKESNDYYQWLSVRCLEGCDVRLLIATHYASEDHVLKFRELQVAVYG